MKIDWKMTEQEVEEYKHIRLSRPSAGQIRKYYSGFNTTRRTQMFEDEMKDLAMVYKHAIEDVDTEMSLMIPSLVYRMKEFIELYDRQEAIEEKLNNLIAKLNPTGE